MVRTNIAAMQNDVRQMYREANDRSHHGHPTIIRAVHSGGRGRPSYWIDPGWLAWAYTIRPVQNIATFLGVSRGVVRTALLQHGIVEPLPWPTSLARVRRGEAWAPSAGEGEPE